MSTRTSIDYFAIDGVDALPMVTVASAGEPAMEFTIEVSADGESWHDATTPSFGLADVTFGLADVTVDMSQYIRLDGWKP